MTEPSSVHVVDPEGRRVFIRIRQFHEHIQRGHSEIDDTRYILEAIEKPSSIWKETRYPDSQVYYKLGVHSEHPDLYIRVVVRSGEVVTAHLIDKPRGRSHVLIWTPD